MDYCSQLAIASDTPLYGTAAQFRVGLLIEYGAEWRNKSITNNTLPDEFNEWLDGVKAAVPGTRPLFICQDRAQSKNDDPSTFYITVADKVAPKVYRFSFTDYAELMTIDVAAVVAGETDDQPVDETIVAVCTNGKHDLCCAKFGMPVYHAFAAVASKAPANGRSTEHNLDPAVGRSTEPKKLTSAVGRSTEPKKLTVWQCTHIGGHRYAATAVALPSGIVYGYLTPENVPTVAEAILADEIQMDYYRGCTLYPGTVSAAEYYAREATGQTGVNSLKLVSAEETGATEAGETHWRVEFKNGSGPHRVVELAQWKTEPVISSCGDKPPKPQAKYRLISQSAG